ncbi:hypothetical protein VTO73DRAFT_13798 [Trametes versicolor]
MSSSDSEFIAEFVAIYQGVKTVYTINVAVVALLVYDALLCIEKEVLYVWRAPKAERKLSRFLYIYNRYMSVLWNLLEMVSVLSRICLILRDAVAVVVTWWRTRTARQTPTDILRQSSLEIIIWDNGNVYFCTIVLMNVADMILAVLSIRGTQLDNLAYVVNFLDPISSILNSRFLLALYETNAHLESGGTSASSFSTLDFREGNPPAGSVALPGYLSSLAGPIYSVPDDGSELFDSDSTQKHEPKRVVGAEVKADLEQVNAGASDRDSIEEVEHLEQV